MIKKVLVANRGEIAMRIFRTCRVMNIPTVAIYTHVDRGALHVRYAEEAYCISEDEADTSYLKPDLILEIAKKTGAAIHPGYGFLSENADFARRCEEEGVIFIGPSADVIAKMGIKTEARKIMKEAGVPVVPGTEKPVTDIEDAKKVAAEVGYPIMLKALAGAPLFEPSFYYKFKDTGKMDEISENIILNCKSSFISPSMPIGIKDMMIWSSYSFDLLRRIDERPLLKTFFNKFIVRMFNLLLKF